MGCDCGQNIYEIILNGKVIETYDHQTKTLPRIEEKFKSVDAAVRDLKNKWRVRVHFTDGAYCDIWLACPGAAHDYINALEKGYGGK